MLIYILIILILGLTYLFRKSLSKKLCNLIIIYIYIILSIVGGIRYNVGTDFELYESIFNRSTTIVYSSDFVEAGYLYINQVLFQLGFSFQFLLLIVSLFINFNFIKGSKKYNDDVLGFLFFFVTTGIYFSSFNIMRQAIVISVFFLCINLFINKKYLPFTLIMLSSYLIHRSIIIVLIIVFLCIIKTRIHPLRLFLTGLFIVLGIINFSNNDLIMKLFFFLPDKYQIYSSSIGNLDGINLINLVLPTIILLLIFIFYNKLIIKNNKNFIFIRLFLIYYILLVFSTKYIDFYRVAAYFEITLLVLIPQILDLIKLKEKWFVDLVIVVLFSTYIIIKLLLGHYGVVPYDYNTNFLLNE
ncbi:EpsG family protein [Niallia sp. MER TA 168]|uniref:EpsG family protein n=1 Tax=Niallia sp. MER TA 168 TaxID=2939568 RepID=UPI00203EC8F3|nr:EpsG family protein [Niallia sp. MER TA 168]